MVEDLDQVGKHPIEDQEGDRAWHPEGQEDHDHRDHRDHGDQKDQKDQKDQEDRCLTPVEEE